jgi:hypothetical protein
VCLETIVYCLELGKEHAEPAHIRQLYDCAEICTTLQDFAILSAHGTAKLAEACVEVCERCAESCESFETDAPIIKCAEVCRRCAKSATMAAEIKLT